MKQLIIRRILFATDFLESSRLALDYAVAMAHHFSASILLLHAVELSPAAEEAEAIERRSSISRQAAEQRLERFAAGLRRLGLDVETLVADGTPCRVILDTVEARQPDLLVLGVHGTHRGLSHLLIGSNTEKILLSVTCPTLSVGAHVLAGIDLKPEVNEILYCSDLTVEAAAALPYALQLGEAFRVPVVVRHLSPPMSDEEPNATRVAAERYCEALRKVAPDVTDEWCTPEFHVRDGTSIDEILKRAEREQSGLIVLGVHAEAQFGRHLHTSLAYQLLTRAICPVLSVRAGTYGFPKTADDIPKVIRNPFR
jgi:nucleotide-binding universal stress UspA family protein